MDENDKLRLQANRTLLVENIKVTDIQDRLISEFILNEEDEENLSRVNSFEAVRLLIKLLQKSPNPSSYRVFCSALDEKGYDFVVTALNETNIQAVKDKAKVDKKRQDDQLEKLQQQVWLQCQMMTDLKKQLDELKAKESSSPKQEEKYSNLISLESKMKDQGISSDDVIQLLLKFMNSGGFSEKEKIKGHREQSKHQADGDFDSEVMVIDNSIDAHCGEVSDSVVEENFSQREICKVAREIGKDIAFYLVMKKNGMEPISPPNKYAAEFRKVVYEVFERYEDSFQVITAELNLEETIGFQGLVTIADEIFKDDVNNWGRILVLYAYVGWLAINMFSYSDQKSWESIGNMGEFLGYYISSRVGEWIEAQGGWDHFSQQKTTDNLFWKSVLIGSLGLLGTFGISLLKS